jgi:hypothetical protein
MVKYNKVLLFAAIAFAFSACDNTTTSTDDPMKDQDSTQNATGDKKMSEEVYFQVPSPGDMLRFIKDIGGKNNKNTSFLNSTENINKYTESASRAINFGMYSCDLSYCSIFEIGVDALKYFKVVRQLGDNLGISSIINPSFAKRMESNVGNPDSLISLSDEIYYSSFETLESSQQGPVLALSVAGGWIESMYIVTNLAKYDAEAASTARIADQKYTLDNMIEFLNKYGDNADVAKITVQFKEIRSVFDKIVEKKSEQTEKKEKGKVVFGGGAELVMDEATYKEIVAKVTSVRNTLAMNN